MNLAETIQQATQATLDAYQDGFNNGRIQGYYEAGEIARKLGQVTTALIINEHGQALLQNPVPQAGDEPVGTLEGESPSNHDDKELL